ncbi:MAG TPA: hypothetical protein VFF73_23860 [Planctomycetota bacterium]|nr:hypothetical protein [Planctomycetota bacterium]
MANDSPSKTEEELRAILSGIQQVLTAGKTFPYKGTSYDQAGLTQLVTGYLAPYESVRNLRTQLKTGVASRKAGAADTKDFIKTFEASAMGQYGESSTEFAAFGFKPHKKAELTVEQKQHKLDQARATRAARHTVGPKQRASIRGVVPPVPSGGVNTPEPGEGNTTGPSGSNVAKP